MLLKRATLTLKSCKSPSFLARYPCNQVIEMATFQAAKIDDAVIMTGSAVCMFVNAWTTRAKEAIKFMPPRML